MSNPYVRVHRRIRAQRGWRLDAWVPLLATSAAVPLVRPTLLWFLPTESVSAEVLAPGLAAVAFRLAALVAGAVILHSYSDLVRGPDRAVLDVHPVRSRLLVNAIARQTARTRLYLPLMAAILLSPVAMAGHAIPWLGAVGMIFSGWLGGLGVGFLVHLGGVWAATSPAFAGVLDALRGDNPPMQAVLIYAPGVALALVGGALGLASIGLEGALRGWSLGWAWLLLPLVVGAVAWAFVGRLADRFYVRATLVLAEIEGQWAGVEEGTPSLRVYLERAGEGRPELLRGLRHGWRSLRLFATGGWMLGFIGAVMAWSDPLEPHVMMMAAGSIVAIAAVVVRMAEGDPPWLDEALGVHPLRLAVARGGVGVLYALGILVPVGLALGLGHGWSGMALLGGLVGLAVISCGLAAGAAWMWRERGIWAYGAVGLLTWAGFVRLIG